MCPNLFKRADRDTLEMGHFLVKFIIKVILDPWLLGTFIFRIAYYQFLFIWTFNIMPWRHFSRFIDLHLSFIHPILISLWPPNLIVFSLRELIYPRKPIFRLLQIVSVCQLHHLCPLSCPTFPAICDHWAAHLIISLNLNPLTLALLDLLDPEMHHRNGTIFIQHSDPASLVLGRTSALVFHLNFLSVTKHTVFSLLCPKSLKLHCLLLQRLCSQFINLYKGLSVVERLIPAVNGLVHILCTLQFRANGAILTWEMVLLYKCSPV